jgi:hypothetical protein
MNASNWRSRPDAPQPCAAGGNDLDCAPIRAIAAGDEESHDPRSHSEVCEWLDARFT